MTNVIPLRNTSFKAGGGSVSSDAHTLYFRVKELEAVTRSLAQRLQDTHAGGEVQEALESARRDLERAADQIMGAVASAIVSEAARVVVPAADHCNTPEDTGVRV